MQHRPALYKIACSALTLALAFLAGCAPVQRVPTGEDIAAGSPQAAYERGDYREAAEGWQKQALDLPEPQSSRARLNAADAWILAGETGDAEALLEWIAPNDLTEAEQSLLALVQAEVAVGNGAFSQAQSLLIGIRPALPGRYSDRFDSLSRFIAEVLEGPGAEGLRESQRIAESMRRYDPEAALQLMKSLERVSSTTLARHAAGGVAGTDRAGWLSLALMLRQNLVDGAGLEPAVRNWSSRFPDHVVSAADALDLWLRYRQSFQTPPKVAVLLPASGPLKAAAAAVRDGIVSAYVARPSGSEIKFYDTGEDPQTAIAAYFQAADEGADWIIGPLAKDSIAALLNLAGLATPVLALNELPAAEALPGGHAVQAVGLALSQEREAAAVARKMRSSGLRKIVLLAPENAWGDVIAEAFRTEFLRQEGEILVSARFLPEENDHSEMLERILKIDESKSRKSQLQDRLGIELEFEPTRRHDIDGIFVAADAQQGRLIRPALRFFEAGDLPAFATSRVYSGRPDPNRNQDIDGFAVPLTSWQFDHPSAQSLPTLQSLRGGEFAPLFAVGMDAWNLLPWIKLMRGDPDFVFSGQTGSIRLKNGSRFEREPRWGYFARGLPVPESESVMRGPW